MAMAGRTEARIAALLSLLAATLIAHALLLHPPRASAITDRLLSALGRFDGRHLVNRRNMILVCHAILFLILRDAGLLAAPARRRGRDEDACCEARPKPKSIDDVDAPRSSTAAGASEAKSAAVADDGGRVQRERRRDPAAEPDETTPRRRRRVKPSSKGAAHNKEHPLAREFDDPAEKQRSERRRCFNGFDDGVGAAVEDEIACLRSQPDARDERRGGKEMAECVDDLDEMNKRFEEFIASMRRKMQLETRQLVKV